MFSKKDLVKQFELVVKQEIIEHNKAITLSNLAIATLRADLETEISKLTESLKSLSFEFSTISGEFNKIKSEFQELSSKVTKSEKEQYRLNERNHKEIEVIDQSIETVHRNEKKLERDLVNSGESISELDKKVTALKNQYDTEFNRLITLFSRNLLNVKEEILAKPTDYEKIKDEFMKELSMHKIDNKGILKEVAVLKKDCYVKEKQIENLYTLIERINKKIE